nr:hypothetical protein [Brucella suis]
MPAPTPKGNISERAPTASEKESLDFHAQGRPGKLEINPTKPMTTQRDLSLAYSPGVAVPVKAIAEDAARAYDYTAKGNLVAAKLHEKIGSGADFLKRSNHSGWRFE